MKCFPVSESRKSKMLFNRGEKFITLHSASALMKQIRTYILIFFLTSLFSTPGFTQSDDGPDIEISNDGKGWIFGLNVGVYYPSKSTANFYNGRSENENSVDYVLSNYYWYQEIFFALNAYDSILVSGLPDNMHYKLAMQPGLYAQYSFNPNLALVIQFNYMRLKANDAITFEVDPKPYATNPDLRLFPMRGVEERVYADIGLKRSYLKSENLSWFLMGGVNVNSTKVKQNSFYVKNELTLEDREYSMINLYGNSTYIPNSNMQTYNVYQGGIGVGMYAGTGLSVVFGNGIVLEPGINMHWLMVKLERYQDMNPGAGVYVRFLF